jgi:GDP-D-mannose 3',5'-epimerase
VNTAGRSFSANGYTCPICGSTAWLSALPRFHNIFGTEGTWTGGKEKAPAALCRKVAEAEEGGEIEIWGDGKQTRSFLYIDECIEGVRRLMESEFTGPVKNRF